MNERVKMSLLFFSLSVMLFSRESVDGGNLINIFNKSNLIFTSFTVLLLIIVHFLLCKRKHGHIEKRYSSLFEFAPISLWEEDFSEVKKYLEKNISHNPGALDSWLDKDPDHLSQCISRMKIRSINRETLRLYRAINKDKIIKHFNSIFTDKSTAKFKEELIAFWDGKSFFSIDAIHRKLDGDFFNAHVNIAIAPGYEKNWKKVFVSVQDETDQIRYQDELIASLEEKKVLLKEIHHRVKNNLAIVSSFLYLQLSDIEDEKMHGILQRSQARIQSMALIHEKLYQNVSISNINLPEYTHSLASYLINSYETEGKEIRFSQDVEALAFSIDQLIPLGLILTEVLSNSMKYAFHEVSQPVLNLKIRHFTEQKIRVIITDNGPGIDDVHRLSRKNSIGMELISSLVDQLDGALSYENNNGTVVSLEFVLQS